MGGVFVEHTTKKMDLTDILAIIENSDQVSNNPFSYLPAEAIEDALEILKRLDKS
jgi:hypothetical protein